MNRPVLTSDALALLGRTLPLSAPERERVLAGAALTESSRAALKQLLANLDGCASQEQWLNPEGEVRASVVRLATRDLRLTLGGEHGLRQALVRIAGQGRQLAATETEQLRELERVIEGGIRHFLAVGCALCRIRDFRLYRATHSSFQSYCEERWGISRSHAYRLVRSVEVVASLPPEVQPAVTESHARVLERVEPESRAAAWTRAASSGNRVTAASLKRAATQVASASPFPLTTQPAADTLADALADLEAALSEAAGGWAPANSMKGLSRPAMIRELARFIRTQGQVVP